MHNISSSVRVAEWPFLRKCCLLGQSYVLFVICLFGVSVISHLRKPAFCICANKDADQLRGNREADQRLCFRYTDSTIPLLPKYEISSI